MATTTAPATILRESFLVSLARTLIIIALPIALTVLSVRFVMSPLFLQLEYNRPGFPADPYGFTTQDRLEYSPPTVAYLLNGADISFLGDLRLPAGKVPPGNCVTAPEDDSLCYMFNTRELRHMHDVKVITRGAYLTGLVATAIGVVAGVYLFRAARTQFRAGLFGGGVLTLGIITMIVLLAITSWEFFFTSFHTLLFEGDSWLFPYSDTLIRLFPEQFWFDAALLTGSLTATGAAIIVGFTWKAARK